MSIAILCGLLFKKSAHDVLDKKTPSIESDNLLDPIRQAREEASDDLLKVCQTPDWACSRYSNFQFKSVRPVYITISQLQGMTLRTSTAFTLIDRTG